MNPSQLDQTLTADKVNSSTCGGCSLSTISSTRTSPRNSLSPNCYGSFSDSPNQSPYSGYAQPQPTELSSVLSEMNNPGEYHGPTWDKKSPLSPGNLSPYDYENKRLTALRVMRSKPLPSNLRVPHNSWSGYGVSHTSPGGFLTDKLRREDEIWKPNSPKQATISTNMPSTSTTSAMMNTSNLLDHTPTHVWNRVSTNSNWHDLPSMLTTMKLEHYIPLFKQHEIDLTIFSTLTDQDLVDIGITAFGARRRLLLVISEMNKRNAPFSAAPGAERRSSSSNSTGHGGTPVDTNW